MRTNYIYSLPCIFYWNKTIFNSLKDLPIHYPCGWQRSPTCTRCYNKFINDACIYTLLTALLAKIGVHGKNEQ